MVHFRQVEQTLACLRSIAKIDYPNLDVLVVDNGAADHRGEPLPNTTPSVEILVASTNGGYTAGNNLGITRAIEQGAQYLHLLNPDTTVARGDYLARAIEYLEAHPEVAAVGPRVHLRKWGQIQNTVLRYPWLARRMLHPVTSAIKVLPSRSADRVLTAEAINGVAVVLRASAIRDVGPLDEALFAYIEDIDWGWRARQRGWRIDYLPVDSVIHHQRADGYDLSGPVDFLLKRNTLYFLRKSGRRWQAAGYTMATLLLGLARVFRPRAGFLDRARWLTGLAAAYAAQWFGKENERMGPPGAGWRGVDA